MYDPICKFLVENFSSDFANWLLGEPISLSTINPSELSLEPIRADSVLLLEAKPPSNNQNILHIEFQTQPKSDIPFRMLDYWVRIYRANPEKAIRQVVIYLRRSQSKLVHQTRFESPNTSHSFEVVRLWEEPFESLLQSPGLLPFAILSDIKDPTTALQQIATKIRETVAPQTQESVGSSTAILAGLVLKDRLLIERIIGMDLLEQSSVYQGLKQEGRQEGRQEGISTLIISQLTRKLSKLSPNVQAQIETLSMAQLESLGGALFDFATVADLKKWLSEL